MNYYIYKSYYIISSLMILVLGCGEEPSFIVQGFKVYDHKSNGLGSLEHLNLILDTTHEYALGLGMSERIWDKVVDGVELHAYGEGMECEGYDNVAGCFEVPDRVSWHQREKCQETFLGHEMAHVIQWYWLEEVDYKHQDDRFWGWDNPLGMYPNSAVEIYLECKKEEEKLAETED